MEETYERFGQLLTAHTDCMRRKAELIQTMRRNLIARNNGSNILRLYGYNRVVNLEDCSFDEMNAANSTLHHNKK